jgi:hypothetical protein
VLAWVLTWLQESGSQIWVLTQDHRRIATTYCCDDGRAHTRRLERQVKRDCRYATATALRKHTAGHGRGSREGER